MKKVVLLAVCAILLIQLTVAAVICADIFSRRSIGFDDQGYVTGVSEKIATAINGKIDELKAKLAEKYSDNFYLIDFRAVRNNRDLIVMQYDAKIFDDLKAPDRKVLDTQTYEIWVDLKDSRNPTALISNGNVFGDYYRWTW
ncbi:hypothetical protein FACS1894217_15430 [Clostridia bacterium]|nr:hypothetical protein FACS1894217_15430 [Clostridia bacterium]